MWDVAWSIVVVLVLALVAVMLLGDALLEKSFWARVGALLALGAGGAQGAEIGAPWLPLSLLIAAVAACLAGHARRLAVARSPDPSAAVAGARPFHVKRWTELNRRAAR
jgi:hypothetical protein